MPRKSTVARPIFSHRGRGLGLGSNGATTQVTLEKLACYSHIQLNSLMLFNTYYFQICQQNVSRQSLTSGEHGLESVKNIVKLLILIFSTTLVENI